MYTQPLSFRNQRGNKMPEIAERCSMIIPDSIISARNIFTIGKVVSPANV